jgi:ribosome-associated heat shock protein Hsp15
VPIYPTDQPLRLDKWLWAARFFKTRSIAKAAVENGKVLYDDRKTKPSRNVEVGAELSIRQGFEKKSVLVLQLSGQRRSAKEAAELYSETEQSIQEREKRVAERKQLNAGQPISESRPTKKQRRQIHKFKETSQDDL